MKMFAKMLGALLAVIVAAFIGLAVAVKMVDADKYQCFLSQV